MAEKGEKSIIYLYDTVSLRKKKILNPIETGFEEFIDIKFNRNEDNILFSIAEEYP